MIKTKQELLNHFSDINAMYNNPFEYQTLSNMIDELLEQEPKTEWIPVSERLPEENEYIGDVCKYYLIQDEYGDMHVAHLSNVGWIPINSLKAIGDEVIAWLPLPQPYKAEESDKDGKL